MTTRSMLLATGVPGLDSVLGGGLARDALVFLVGTPGAGKTILAAQILFNIARQNEPALILTGFSEGHVKLLEHLHVFSFYEQSLVGNQVTLLSLQSLVSPDPEAATSALVRTIRQSGARLVMLDGYQTLRAVLGSPLNADLLIASLANQLTYLGVTLLVVAEGSARRHHFTAALTTADVALSLDYALDGWRHVRRLEVIKQRGRQELSGFHSFAITSDGISIYPRLESLPPPPEWDAFRLNERAPFGIPTLDILLNGGLTVGTCTLLTGDPGVGKTLLALQWGAASPTPETPTIFVSFRETPGQLSVKGAVFGLDLAALRASQAFRLIHMSQANINPDELAARLLAHLSGTRGARLVIDSLDLLAQSLGARARAFLGALKEQLHAHGVTSLLLADSALSTDESLQSNPRTCGGLYDNLITIAPVVGAGTRRHMLSVLKMAFSAHDTTAHELLLDANTIHLRKPSPANNQ